MLHDDDPLSSFDDTDSEHPALVTFIGGSEALRVSDLTEPQLVTELVTHLTLLLGPWVTQYTDITVKNWADEEWIGGEWEMYNDKVSKLKASSRVFFLFGNVCLHFRSPQRYTSTWNSRLLANSQIPS